MAFANLDSENLFQSFDDLSSHRSVELAKAGSGIDISGYPLPLKLFTFWFRPLFVDAPGPIGIIVSFENLFYLWLASSAFSPGFFKFMSKASALVKTSAVAFLATSVALSGTLSNLGIIIRQKSMVMYFFLFILIMFMDYKKASPSTGRKKYKPNNQHQPFLRNPYQSLSRQPLAGDGYFKASGFVSSKLVARSSQLVFPSLNPLMKSNMQAIFTISLDFELHWGVFDKKTVNKEKPATAIPCNSYPACWSCLPNTTSM